MAARREVGEAVNGRVLELGTGTGLSLPQYGPLVSDLIGVDHLWPVALVQDLVSPLTVRLECDHFNRRTAETIAAAGIEIESVHRWALGFFT